MVYPQSSNFRSSEKIQENPVNNFRIYQLFYYSMKNSVFFTKIVHVSCSLQNKFDLKSNVCKLKFEKYFTDIFLKLQRRYQFTTINNKLHRAGTKPYGKENYEIQPTITKVIVSRVGFGNFLHHVLRPP